MRKTISQLLQSASRQINNLDAELILSHILTKPREYILSHPKREVNLLRQVKFKKLVKKRANNVPLAYITGHKEFFGLDFIVNKHTLIPRPDTETLVEEVIDEIKGNYHTLIDIGTGSGCIPIAITKTLKHKNTRLPVPRASTNGEHAQTIGVDISKKALKVARKNAKKHKVDITFLHGDLLSPIITSKHLNTQTFKHVFITANLPYLTEEQYKSEPSIQHEPKSALVAKNNGLALYKKLLQQIQQLSITHNLQPITYFEIDPSQTQRITSLVKEILPKAKIEIKKDLAGQDRVVVVK